jgi:hypothetical protein
MLRPRDAGGIRLPGAHTGSVDRRRKALIMLFVAVLAVLAFGLGLTLCIDWGGASAPPHDYDQPAALVLSFL